MSVHTVYYKEVKITVTYTTIVLLPAVQQVGTIMCCTYIQSLQLFCSAYMNNSPTVLFHFSWALDAKRSTHSTQREVHSKYSDSRVRNEVLPYNIVIFYIPYPRISKFSGKSFGKKQTSRSSELCYTLDPE